MNKIQKVVKKIAKREGVSVEEVYREMQIAVDIGYSNPDPAVQAVWKKIPMPCGEPRPEDVITYCVEKLALPHSRKCGMPRKRPFLKL